MSVVFVANDKASELLEPTYSAFHFPPTTVTPQLTTVLQFGLRSILPVGADQVPAFFPKPLAQRPAVVGFVGDERRGRVARGDFLKDSFRQRDLSRASRRGPACEWNSLAIDHHHKLCTLSAFGRSDAVAPFFAG